MKKIRLEPLGEVVALPTGRRLLDALLAKDLTTNAQEAKHRRQLAAIVQHIAEMKKPPEQEMGVSVQR
jgi:hypothetical protein